MFSFIYLQMFLFPRNAILEHATVYSSAHVKSEQCLQIQETEKSVATFSASFWFCPVFSRQVNSLRYSQKYFTCTLPFWKQFSVL